MRDRLNIKFLAYVLVSGLVFSVGWYYVHAFQMQRTAGDLLKRAGRAEEEGQLDRAELLYSYYVELCPQDVEALARYGLLLDKRYPGSEMHGAIMDIFEAVLRREPERVSIRKRLAQVALQEEDVATALTHLMILRKSSPTDGEVAFLLGWCHAAQANPKAAQRFFQSAIELTPTGPGHVHLSIYSYVALASLTRQQLQMPEDADQLIDELVERNRQAYQAYLARARWRLMLLSEAPQEAAAKLTEQAVGDVAEALRLAPAEPELLFLASKLAQDQGKFEDARGYLRRALKAKPQAAVPDQARLMPKLGPLLPLQEEPRLAKLYETLAALEVQAGRPVAALESLEEGLKALPEHPALLRRRTDLLIDQGKLAEAQKLIDQMDSLRLKGPPLEFLRGAILVAKGEWRKAIEKLEATAPLLEDSTELQIRSRLLLGHCYEELGDLDQELIAYGQAKKLDAVRLPARFGLAAVLARSGRFEEAIEEYQKAMQFPKAPAIGWVILARTMILHNLRVVPSQRHWEQIEQILAKVPAAPDGIEMPLLHAEVLAGQKKFGEARSLLEKARVKKPKSVELWTALAALAEREGQWQSASRTLDEAERHLGDSAVLRLARLRLLLHRDGPKAAPSLPGLAAGLDKLASDERVRLFWELANAYAVCGQPQEALKAWSQAAALQPNDLRVRVSQFELALQLRNQTTLEACQTAVARVEGPGGPYGIYCAACQQILQAEEGKPADLAGAREQLVAIGKRRPDWPRIPVCLARIDELVHKWDSAIDNYRHAIQLGDQRPGVVRQLVLLSYQRQRYTEVEDAVTKLQEQTPISNDLQKLAAEAALRTPNPGRALDWAHLAVSATSADYRDHIWLGQILWARDRKAEAERAFRRAITLADGRGEPWVALVQFQVRLGQIREAEATIQEARRRLGQAGAVPLAQCYEVFKRLDLAQEQYRAALAAHPEDLDILRVVADFYVRSSQFLKAEPSLRKLFDPRTKAPDSLARWARRSLAIGLAVAGTFPHFQEALALIEYNLKEMDTTVDDQVAKAVILASRPVYRRQAIPVLEKAFEQQPPTPDLQLLLVKLYEAYGNKSAAPERMARLLALHGDNPRYLAHHVSSQLRQANLDQAEAWLGKLHEVQPHAFSTVTFQARLLALRGKGQQVLDLLNAYLDNKDSEPSATLVRCQLTAGLLDQLSQDFGRLRSLLNPVAEALYRRKIALSNNAESLLALASFLARNDRVSEALDLCERAGLIGPLEAAAATSVLVVNRASATEEHLGRVEGWLTVALQKQPRVAVLQVSLALLRERQSRYEEAEALYRKVLEQDNNNAVASNNLAYLHLLREANPEECLDRIEHAIKVTGPTADFLDTRAMIYLAQGKSDLAIADLKEALADTPTANSYFHLAQACQTAGQLSAAAQALGEAKKLGLKPKSVHPLEQATCQRLLDTLTSD
jgi:tetratricopeptide (TPR) repeat protein